MQRIPVLPTLRRYICNNNLLKIDPLKIPKSLSIVTGNDLKMGQSKSASENLPEVGKPISIKSNYN